MHNISPEQLSVQLNNGPRPVLLDVREDWEYEICKLEGSIHIPMSCISERLNELDQSQETVVICHHGMRSLQVGQFLQGLGFDKVINLDGGLDAWAKTVDADMPQY